MLHIGYGPPTLAEVLPFLRPGDILTHCFTGGDMRIIEKFTRTGNQILHEMTIHDPESFVEPWVMPARTLRLGNGNALIAERNHCEIYEEESITTQLRH